MQNFIYTFVVVILLSTMGTLYAQEINGTITDEKGKAVATATISLLKPDSSWSQSEITDDNGGFVLKNVHLGKYIIAVNAIGYKAVMQTIEVKEKMEALKISMTTNTTLQEAVLTDKLPTIEKGLGKMVVNFKQGTGQGESVFDLLRKSPGVNVSNGDIRMRGTGAMVLVDDKQTYLSGKDLEDYLKSLPADQIAVLELITQPSSKYDAEGVGGIINIKTRKIRRRGINGNISMACEQGIYANTHNNANLTYRNGKLTTYANAGYMAATGCLNRKDQRKVVDEGTGVVNTQTVQSAFMKETFSDANLKLGADYSINDKATAGASVKSVYHPNKEEDAAKTILNDVKGAVVYNNTDIEQGLLRKYTQTNAYVKYKTAKDQEISVDADYLYRNQQGHQLINSSNYDINQQPLTVQNLRDHKSSVIEVPVVKVDYNATLAKDWKLEAGVKCSYAHLDKDEYFEGENKGLWAYDTLRSNHFVYTENISAAYASVSKQFGKKWNTQLGLRVENTVSNGNQITQNKEFEKQYTSAFPTAFVSYKINDKHSVDLSCGRRIERPAYTMLDPFISYFTQYFYHVGNPNLQPSFRNYIDVSHNYKDMLFTSFGCGKVSGVITPVMEYNPVTNAVFATFGNYADRFVAHGTVTFNKKVAKWWQLSTEGNVYYNKFLTLSGNNVLATSIGYSFHMNHELVLVHGWAVDTTFYYNSGDLQNLIDRYGPNYWLGFNVSKKLLKDTATIRLSVDDPFNMYSVGSTGNWNGIQTASSLKFNSQSIGLGFTYNFGKKLENTQQRQANSEEAGRM